MKYYLFIIEIMVKKEFFWERASWENDLLFLLYLENSFSEIFMVFLKFFCIFISIDCFIISTVDLQLYQHLLQYQVQIISVPHFIFILIIIIIFIIIISYEFFFIFKIMKHFILLFLNQIHLCLHFNFIKLIFKLHNL